MSDHVVLNLLNDLKNRDKIRGLPSSLSLFRNKLNNFNTTGAHMLDSIYHVTLKLLWIRVFACKRQNSSPYTCIYATLFRRPKHNVTQNL